MFNTPLLLRHWRRASLLSANVGDRDLRLDVVAYVVIAVDGLSVPGQLHSSTDEHVTLDKMFTSDESPSITVS